MRWRIHFLHLCICIILLEPMVEAAHNIAIVTVWECTRLISPLIVSTPFPVVQLGETCLSWVFTCAAHVGLLLTPPPSAAAQRAYGVLICASDQYGGCPFYFFSFACCFESCRHTDVRRAFIPHSWLNWLWPFYRRGLCSPNIYSLRCCVVASRALEIVINGVIKSFCHPEVKLKAKIGGKWQSDSHRSSSTNVTINVILACEITVPPQSKHTRVPGWPTGESELSPFFQAAASSATTLVRGKYKNL